MALIHKKDNNVLLAAGDQLISYDLESQADELLRLPEPNLPEKLTKSQLDVLKKEVRKISSIDSHSEKGYTVVATENKQVVVYDKQFQVLKNFIVNRAAGKVCFTPSSDILVADRTGDVYLYKLNEIEAPQLLLGHLSVILDMTLSECGKYIITFSFCLGHSEFVTSIKLVKNILVSASGDGTVRFWNYLKGEQLDIIYTNKYIMDNSLLEVFTRDMDKEKVDVTALPVTDMQVYYDAKKLYVAVSVHNYNALQIHTTDLLSCDLYILSDKFSVFKLIDEEFIETNVPCLEKLYDKYKHILKLNESSAITVLYKRKFDNVQEYLVRKRQRLETK
ncbi:hypothetical protein NQ315_004284 [Exocentrus adspersus]|uniref:tRNA (guanine-N(7)-)-methyltransferase non-catalytic subunit wuho n=1 Tax=Exocentrus adspersus TaxID=1586481 RepID=A0AAV8W855_9CUCU|nr:hypothetical protein NQ315_004284 [Exocentrus adspersus]